MTWAQCVYIVLGHFVTCVILWNSYLNEIENCFSSTEISLLLPLYSHTCHLPLQIFDPRQRLICAPPLWFYHFENVIKMETYSVWPCKIVVCVCVCVCFSPSIMPWEQIMPCVSLVHSFLLLVSNIPGADTPPFV